MDLKTALLLVTFCACASSAVRAGTKCVKAKGELVCKLHPDAVVDVEVRLMDDDGFLNNDDQMGFTTSDENGKFYVEGCGYDFLSDPDPYLKIWHKCGGEHREIRTPIQMIFQPKINDFGRIILDPAH